MQVEALVPETAVERFDIGIVCRLARSTEHQGHLVLVHPQVRQPPGKLAAVVHMEAYGMTLSQ